MSLYYRLLCLCSCVLGAILTGCGSVNGVRITEGKQEAATETIAIAKDAAIIVHIDLFERIATIRNGAKLNADFLIATNYAGLETGVLKVRKGSSQSLRAVDILEGSPKINNLVRPASSDRSETLAKMYRDPADAN